MIAIGALTQSKAGRVKLRPITSFGYAALAVADKASTLVHSRAGDAASGHSDKPLPMRGNRAKKPHAHSNLAYA